MNMKLNAGEILDIAAWIQKNKFERTHDIIIEQTQTGMGMGVEAKASTSEKEGIFIDVTDYDTW